MGDAPITPDSEPTSPEPAELPELGSPCRHLRHKGMYIYTDGEGSHEDDGSRVYWCFRSLKEYGPDDGLVGGEDCRETIRTCYEPN